MTTVRVNLPEDNWTWLLRVPIARGDPIPLELWFLYHYGTVLPLQRSAGGHT